MKKEIHPKYVECKVACGCGNSWMTRSTVATLSVEVCSNCHPFFTGQQKFIDTAGRVERFQKKYAWDAEKVVTKADEADEAAKVAAKEGAKPAAAKAKVKVKPPIAMSLHTTGVKGKLAPKTIEGLKGEGGAGKGGMGGGMGGRMGGGPGGAGGRMGGGPGGAGGGGGRPGGGRGGRGPKKSAPASTERQRIGKPKAAEPPAAEAPKPEAPAAETPPAETPPAETPPAETPKPTEGQA